MFESILAWDTNTFLVTRQVWGKALTIHFKALGLLANAFATGFVLLTYGMAVLQMIIFPVVIGIVIIVVMIKIMIIVMILEMNVWLFIVEAIHSIVI